METIKLTPACKDYLWGGEKLRQDYGIQSQLHPLAEAWVLSCHPDGPSVVATGPLAGKTLPEYIQEKGPGCLGAGCEKFTDFPILAKFIDAKGDLSIQVHPSNEYALAHEHQFGKTEMWYVLDCEPGATLYYGFQHQISREEFQQRIQEGTVTQVLDQVEVHPGDVFFIQAGTIHAIGAGILICEIQQNSNVTYRIYDYGRVGADGKPRQLHIQQALEVTQRTPPQPDPDFHGHLAQCPYFTVDVMEGRFTLDCGPESFVSVLVLEGTGALWEGDESMSLRKGESLFIPAGAGQCRLEGDGLKCLVTRV